MMRRIAKAWCWALLPMCWASSPLPAQEDAENPFLFGIYGGGGDEVGMRYLTLPSGQPDARSYFRQAFQRAVADGFDYATFNHVGLAILPMILDEAERAGIPYIHEGGDWPSYYGLVLVDPVTGDLVLDTTIGFQEFPPLSPTTPYRAERMYRRELMSTRMLPWVRDAWPILARHPAANGWTPVEEPPVDPMIDEDLAEVACGFRAADDGRHTLAMIYKDLRTLESGVPLMKPDLVRAGFFGMGGGWEAGELGGNWWYAEDATDDAATVCGTFGARYHVFVSGAYDEVLEDGRWVPGQGRRVTIPELRSQFWIALLNGAKGIEVFCYNSIDDASHLALCAERGVQPYDFGSGPTLWTRQIGLYDMADRETAVLRDLRGVMNEFRPLRDLLGNIVPIERRRGGADFQMGIFPYRRDGVSAIRAREFVHPTSGQWYLGLFNGDVVRERPIDLDLAQWSRGLPIRVLQTGEIADAATLQGRMLPPGGGHLLELDPR